MTRIEFDPHDHTGCIDRGVQQVVEQCKEKGLRFTPIRQHVLEILLGAHRAFGAYEVLEILRCDGHVAQPPTVYRALDFLVENGFAHKIEGLNAFVACAHPDAGHAPAFLICRDCGGVAETVMQNAPHVDGFQVEHIVQEVIGLCPNCQNKGAEYVD